MKLEKFKSWRRLLVAAIGLAAAAATTSVNAEELKIGYYAGAVMTIPSWIAQAKGFYKAEGLDVTLIPVANGPLMSSNTASGAIDIGYNSPSNVGLTREQGLNQTIVLGNMIMPIVLLARTDVKIPHTGHYPQDVADLKGLNWGSHPSKYRYHYNARKQNMDCFYNNQGKYGNHSNKHHVCS